MRSLDDRWQARISGITGREHPGAFELEDQPGQGMGEYVVHLPGQPLAFGQPGRLRLRGPGALKLDQQQLGLVAGLHQPPGQQRHARETDDRDTAEQRPDRRAPAHHHGHDGQARDDDDGQRDRQAIGHSRREQDQSDQKPGQASRGLHDHERGRTGDQRRGQDDPDHGPPVPDGQDAKNAKRESAHDQDRHHVADQQPRVAAVSQSERYHRDEQDRSDAARPPQSGPLAGPRPAQSDQCLAAHGLSAHGTKHYGA